MNKSNLPLSKDLKQYHLIYTTRFGNVKSVYKLFKSFADAEIYLYKIKAKHWEIGI